MGKYRNTRGANVRPNAQQGNSNASSTPPADEELIPHIDDEADDAFDDAVNEALGTDLESVLSDSDVSLDEAPSLDEMGLVEADIQRVVRRGQPLKLQAPEPRPGYVQRLGAFFERGKSNPDNIAKLRAEGYRPRKASTLTAEERRRYRCEKLGDDAIVRIGRNYILVERRVEVANYFRQMHQQQIVRNIAAVSEGLQANAVPGMLNTSIEEMSESREFHRRRAPTVAPNRNQ